jgi:hypothetical protein
VNVHHIRDARPDRLPAADLYVFSSPGRMGRPIGGMRRFLKGPPARWHPLRPAHDRGGPQPDKKTGRMPTEDELARFQRVRPIMHELLQAAGLVERRRGHVCVTGMKGPLEDGWQDKVAAFAARIPLTLETSGG